MDKVRINIVIGGHKHPMEVNADEEPIYREAGRLVNERLRAYATAFRGANLPSDFMMAFAAVDIASRYVRLKNETSLEAETSSLREMTADLKAFLESR